jgi:hypothetical protein
MNQPFADGPVLLICAKKKGSLPGLTVPQSVAIKCDKCGDELLVAPSGQAILKERKAIPICIDCVVPGVKEGWIIERLTGYQIEEIPQRIKILGSQRNN